MEEFEIQEKPKKKKFIGLITSIILIIVCVICFIAFVPSGDTNSNSNNTSTSTTSSGLTYANYNKIKNGMTYSEVVSILGMEGKLDTSGGYGGYTLEYYSWEKDTLFSYIVITIGFENGKVCAKSQIGL